MVVLSGARAAAQSPAVPASYHAITSRITYPKPALPVLGAAGSLFIDPTFGSRMLRVTDAQTRPGMPGRSFTTPSAAHQLSWNATSDKFWIRSVDGTIIPYSFDPNAMTIARFQPSTTGDGGLTISSQVEPQFSFVSPNLLFGSTQDPDNDWPIIRQFDFNTLTYTNLLNLGNVTTVTSSTYAGALSSSNTAPETLSVIFGGVQDSHYKVAVFRADTPASSVVVLDTRASTITRGAVTTKVSTLGFFLHHAAIDASGRYVALYPVDAVPEELLIWDLATDAITPVTTRADGHDVLGFGRRINQSCCTISAQDAVQFESRTLSSPSVTTDLILPVLSPAETFIASHASWNNAQPGTLAPVLTSLYRYFNGTQNTTPWRAWDDEIVAIQTDASPLGATVWRFAHHRSDVAYDGNGSAAVYFWYLPRAVISPDGRWAMFTSNWEKTLGPTVGSEIEQGGLHRCDVFLVALAKGGTEVFTDDPLAYGGLIKPIHITELRVRIDALRVIAGLPPFVWTDPSLVAGMFVRAAHLTELRTALGEAYQAKGRTPPNFTDPSIVPGVTAVKLLHIQELRDRVIDLEIS